VDGLLTAAGFSRPNYAAPPQRIAFFKLFEERLRALPGVADVAIASSQPIGGFNSSGPLIAEGKPEPAPGPYRRYSRSR